MITCPHCNHTFEAPAGSPVPHVANKPYVGRLFYIKNVQRLDVRQGNLRAKAVTINRSKLPAAAMILDEKSSFLSIADANGTIYWIKRSYFYKEAFE